MIVTVAERWLALGLTALALGLAWAANNWPDATGAATTYVVGVAVVWVTWRYTGHTAQMVLEMRAERADRAHEAAEHRHRVLAGLLEEIRCLRQEIPVWSETTRPDQRPQPELVLYREAMTYLGELPDELRPLMVRMGGQLRRAQVLSAQNGKLALSDLLTLLHGIEEPLRTFLFGSEVDDESEL